MNLKDLNNIWEKNIQSKIYILISVFLGIFFLFSMFSKILSFTEWLDFNYGLVENKLGYFNGIIILIIELFFGLSFLLLRINKTLLISCFFFILTITLIVLINKKYFQSCMCFGDLITIKPDMYFVLKNSSLLFFLYLIYLLHKNIHTTKNHSNEKN